MQRTKMEDEGGYIISGPPHKSDITAGCASLGSFVRRTLVQNGMDVALIDGVFGTELTYLELLERATQLADCLLTVAGIRDRDVVGVVSENNINYPIVLVGLFLLGATVAPINITYTERMATFQISFYLESENGDAPGGGDAVIFCAGI